MIRLHILVLTVAVAAGLNTPARADQVTTFENVGLPVNSYDNNASPSGQFVIDGNAFNNSFDTTFGSWSGWALSTMTDTTTAGYKNQYSAITGEGAGHSQTYAVAFTNGLGADLFHPAESFIDLAPGTSPLSIQVTNTTYAYLSMLNGDQFAKAFG